MSLSAEIRPFFDEPTNTITYLVFDPETRQAAVIDPVLDYDPASGEVDMRSVAAVLAEANRLALDVRWALETHVHADHLSGAPYIKAKTGAQIGIGERITDVQRIFRPIFNASDLVADGGDFDRLLADGDRLPLGELEIEVIHTPGHTPACVSYRIGDAVFVGDTLFMPDFGTARADFPGGDAATLYRSIQRLLALPPETRVFVGHDYLPKDGRTGFCWETTVAAERDGNIHVGGGTSEADFVAMRAARDATLPPPKLLEPALRANIRAGATG